ncbi:MAG: hypothetical protein PUD72_05640 [Oscillospiraceae bacterium]|nr:hypothetical protein [Oscillospiraceae bacterium]
MKICNYCGTGMDNQADKCPFCGLEMSLKGAIKYQDNKPFNGDLSVVKSKDGKTNAEKNFESMTSDSFSSSLVELIKNKINEGKDAQKVKKPASTFNEVPAGNSFEKKTKQKVKTVKPIKNKSNTSKISVLVFVVIFVIVSISIIGEFVSKDMPDFNKIFNEQFEYLGAEFFERGTYDDNSMTYVNEYMGIKYAVPSGYENTELYEYDDDLSYVNEFEAYNDDYSARISVSYINKDYFYMDSSAEMLDEKKSWLSDEDNIEIVKDVEITIDDNVYIGCLYKDKLASSYADQGERYTLYLVSDYSEYYFTVIELFTDNSEADFEDMLKGFN